MKRYLADLVRHRDLLFWLAAKEIKVRYKVPLLGFLWALLVPLLWSTILWFIFTYVTPVPMTGHCPFFLFLITGMFPWNFFAQSLSNSTTSVLEAGSLIRKTTFPRALLPLSIVASNLFNFVLALLVVIMIVVSFGVPISPWIGVLPVALGVELILMIGMTLLVAGFQVRYRDVKYLTELGLLLWFNLTPIFYPLHLIDRLPPVMQGVYRLNPFVGIVALYRLALLGGTGDASVLTWEMVASSLAISCGLLAVGWTTFRRREPGFADWVMG